MASGQRLLTTSAIHSAPSALTWVIWAHRPSPDACSASKKACTVARSRPGLGPHQPAAVVVDHDGQVLVAALVGDLIDPDPLQAGQRVDPRGGVGPHPSDDGSDCAPGDSHQLGDRSLRALCGQPGHLLIERAGVSSAVSGPGDLSHRRPVSGAVDPRGVSFEEDPDGSHVEPTPPPPPLTTVIPGGPRSARSASTPARLSRPHVDHENLCLAVEPNALHHRVLDAQQGAP